MRRLSPLLLLLAVLIAALWMLPGGDVPSPPASAPAEATAVAPAAPAVVPVDPERRSVAPVVAGSAALRRYPIERAVVACRGVVGDEHEQPVADVEVTLRPDLGGSHPLLPIADDRTAPPATATDAEGRFGFDRVAVGPWLVTARAADGRTAQRRVAITAASEPLRLQLEGAAAGLRVAVIDAAEQPVEGASVQLRAVPDDDSLVAADAAPDRRAVTAADGSCTFAPAPVQALVVTAQKDDLAAHAVLPSLSPHDPRHELVLKLVPTGSLVGELTGVEPDELRGASMQALAMLYPDQAYYTGIGSRRSVPIDGGRFTFAALPAGRYALHLQSPRGLRLALPPLPDIGNSVRPLVVAITAGERQEITAAVEAGGRIDGVVRRDDGTPVEGALVTTVLVPRTSNFPDGFELQGAVVWRLDSALSAAQVHPAAHQRTRTDAQGHYELLALPEGRHRVEVFAHGLEFVQRTEVAVAAATPVTLDFTLAAAGVLQGFLPGGSYLGVRRVGDDRYCQLAILPASGAFTFAGLAAGDYEVGKPDPQGQRFARLARTHVEAGRTTWLDLRDAGPVRIGGVLLDADGAPVQAEVRLWSQRAHSRSDGSFELHLPWPLSRGFGEQHLQVQIDGLRWQLPIPEAALTVDDWRGEFRLGGHRLSVLLVDADGTPMPGLLSVSGGSLHQAQLRVGADGTASLPYLEPGKYVLSASAPETLVPSVEVQVPAAAVQRLAASPSTVLDVLALDADGRPRRRAPIQIAVWRGDGPAPLEVSAYAGPWYGADTGADGHARITVPIGELLVSTLVWDTDVHQQQVLRTVRGAPAAVTLQLPR